MDLRIKAKYSGEGQVDLFLRSGASCPAVFCSVVDDVDKISCVSSGTDQIMEQYVDILNDAFNSAGLLDTTEVRNG